MVLPRRLLPLVLVLATPATSPPVAGEEPVLGAPAAFDLRAVEETVEVTAGRVLYARPDNRSTPLLRLGETRALPLLDRQGPWLQVRIDQRIGWVHPTHDDPQAALARPEATVRYDRTSTRRLRTRALELLGGRPQPVELGPFTLYTDLQGPVVRRPLERAMRDLPDLFDQRFGLALHAETTEPATVVVFTTTASYHAWSLDEPRLEGSIGHARDDLAVLAAGARPKAQMVALLVHELTHVLLYRSFGNLPIWLDEGLAEEISFVHFGRRGPDPKRLSNPGSARMVSDAIAGNDRVQLLNEPQLGGIAGRRTLRAGWRRATGVSLEDFTRLEAADFSRSQDRFFYALAGSFVRFLLEGGDEGQRVAFRTFLRDGAAGGPLDGRALIEHLGTDWPTLEARFVAWAELEPRPEGAS